MGKMIIQKEIDSKSGMLKEFSLKCWENPETAYKEHLASKWTAELLEKEGFQVETGYAGIPTAIKASYGSGKPVIGFLGEYDALPGLSQKVKTTKDPVKENAPGHGCGHNLIAGAHVGAVIGLKKAMEEKGLAGTIVFYGCPGEEVLTGKPFMARGGAFTELDASFQWHPGMAAYVSMGRMTAMNSAKFHFKGVTAHAGADPHNGRSALDAAELMNVGANFLREHVTDDVRIHYVLTEAGTAPNIVPDKATVWYYVRALSREAVVDTYERLVRVAKGAAMMTDTEVSIEFLGGCYNTQQNRVLLDLVCETMTEMGPIKRSQEELDFAAELNKASYLSSPMMGGDSMDTSSINDTLPPVQFNDLFGSSDVGDVQHIAPGFFYMTAAYNSTAVAHSWQATACAGTDVGLNAMLYNAKAMAIAGLRLLEDKELLAKAQEEFKATMKGREYICPIPGDVKIPE